MKKAATQASSENAGMASNADTTATSSRTRMPLRAPVAQAAAINAEPPIQAKEL